MVQQTRKIVENYILFKIHSTFSADTYFSNVTEFSNRKDILQRVKDIPKPQNLSQIDFEVRNVACRYEQQYKDTFPELLEEMRYSKL